MVDWRSARRVLVTEAQTIGSIGVIRSLGAAGYRVHAMSAVPNALGFKSRYCEKGHVQPHADPAALLPWLDELLADVDPQLIIPSESFLIAIRSRFDMLQPLLPVPFDEERVYRALSKFGLFRHALDWNSLENLPPFRLFDESDALPSVEEIAQLGTPLYLKVDAVHARQGEPGAVLKSEEPRDALAKLAMLRTRYRKVLVQGHVHGVGVGAFLVRWKGTVLARFMHKRIHEVPHTGGASSFRETWHHQGIMDDATRRLSEMDWDGAGMFEYRWDPSTDRYYLMEFNSRFWGSLHLALFAGVDFPRILADAFFDRPQAHPGRYARVRSRLTFPKEVEYVNSCIKDQALPFGKKAWCLLEFCLLGLDPSVRSDLNYPGDRRLYWRAIPRALRQFLS